MLLLFLQRVASYRVVVELLAPCETFLHSEMSFESRCQPRFSSPVYFTINQLLVYLGRRNGFITFQGHFCENERDILGLNLNSAR